jgi:hypothetical protein
MVKFPFEFIILKMFIAETNPFSRKRKFSRNEISQNFTEICSFSHHFRFSRQWKKTVFVSTLAEGGEEDETQKFGTSANKCGDGGSKTPNKTKAPATNAPPKKPDSTTKKSGGGIGSGF